MARPVGIVGLGSHVPERVMTNFDLEKIVETSDEWITTRTGIKERRIAAPDEATSDLGYRAAQKALEDAGIGPEEVDCIIVATSVPDMIFPSTACLIQERLGAKRAAAFDLQAACSGFLYALEVGRTMVGSGGYDTVLVIGADVLSRVVDWTDRSTCVLLGDGAGAAVLRPVPEGRGIVAVELGADGSQKDLLHVAGGGTRHPASAETIAQGLHFFRMNGRETFRQATRIMDDVMRSILDKAGLRLEDVDLLVPHQANLRIITHLAKSLGLSMERVMVNVDRYGNTSAATIPLALTEARQAGRIQEGDAVLLVAFGGGLTWGAALIRW